MPVSPTSAELGDIIDALKSPIQRSGEFSSILADAADTGWIALSEIDDYLYAVDKRALGKKGALKAKRWCEIFDLPYRMVCRRPRSTAKSVISFAQVAVADFAQLLIFLEQLGFRSDPKGIVDLLIDEIKLKEKVNSSELSVIWFNATRWKNPPLNLVVDERQGFHQSENFVSEDGYKIYLYRNSSGDPLYLTSIAPKYRRRKSPQKTVCSACGYEWLKGDTESSASHRREHKYRLGYLDPQPFFKPFHMVPNEIGLIEVTSGSKRDLHKEIYLRAIAFRREFGYDFVQWQSSKRDDDPNVHGYLFINDKSVIVGACAFRLRDFDSQKRWGLQWIWVTPKYRRMGVLIGRWGFFRRVFGDFYIEPPVSGDMQRFLKKMGDEALLD